MSWCSLVLLGLAFAGACAAISSGGPVAGASVGGGFFVLVAALRFCLEWADRYGWPGRLRRRLEGRGSG